VGVLVYAYLSGEHRELPILELKSLMEAEDVEYREVYVFDQVALIEVHDDRLFNVLSSRAVLTKYAGYLLGLIESDGGVHNILKALKNSKLCELGGYSKVNFKRVKTYGLGIRYEDLITEINRSSASLCKNVEGSYLDIILTEGVAILGLRKFTRSLADLRSREPTSRPVYRPGTMTPYWARVFVNLSRASVSKKHLLLDPFCGVGGFLLESCAMGLKYCGLDINEDYVKGAVENLTYFNCEPNVVVGDACKLPFDKVDAVATDPPYGRLTKPSGVNDLLELTKCFIEELSKVLKDGGYAVFAQRSDIPVEEFIEVFGLKLVDRVLNWVHGSLTRSIYVVRK